MPKVESSPTSPVRAIPSSTADSIFSCLPSPYCSTLSLSPEVCLSFLIPLLLSAPDYPYVCLQVVG